MPTIARIDGLNILDIIIADTRVFLEIARMDGLDTGTFRFASTDSDTFRIQSITSTSGINIFAVNNNNITHTQSYPAGGIPPTNVAIFDLTANTGETDIYFTGFDLSTVGTLNMAFSNDLNFLNTSLMTGMDTLLLRLNPSLTAIDLTTNTSLQTLDIGFVSQSTGITDLENVVGIENTILVTLNADNLFLTGFGNLNQVTTLQTIRMNNTRAASIDVSGLTNLLTLIAGDNRFTSIDLSNNTALTGLSMPSSTFLNTIDLSSNTLLSSVDFTDSAIPNGISGVNLLTNLSLFNLRSYQGTDITFNSNFLTICNVRNCDNLTTITGYNVASLTIFNIQDSTSTTTSTIDLSNATGLTQLVLRATNTSSLTLPATLSSLASFDVSDNGSINNATFSVSGMTVCTSFLFQDSNFSSSQLDQFFIDIDANTTVTGTINVSGQSGGGAPTAASLSARNNLTTNGWTIIL